MDETREGGAVGRAGGDVARGIVEAGADESVRLEAEGLLQELEDAVTKQQRGARFDRVQIERALNLLWTNRLTAILEPGFSLQALFDGRVDAAPQPAATSPLPVPEDHVPAPPVRRHRAIIFDNQA